MFEQFPYADMQQMNLDWMIKIAKDFLDQYTHIQQLIADGEESLQNLTEEGLQQLQEKADNLTALLQAWYNEHSEDIANQLADALNDLNDWYTEHQGFLDSYVAQSKQDFDTYADAKTAAAIASIPSDYSTFFADAIKGNRTVFNASNLVAPYNDMDTLPWNQVIVFLGGAAALVAHAPTTRWFQVMTYCYDSTGNGVSGVQLANGVGHESANRYWIRIKFGENAWGDWRELASVDAFTDYIKSNRTVFTSSNIAAPYNDMNTLPMNEIVVYLENATASLSNKPTNYWFTAITFCFDPTGNGVSTVQLAFQIGGANALPNAGTVFSRVKTGENAWTPWTTFQKEKNFYVSLSGSYEGHTAYTTFRAGLEAAMQHEYSTLYINSGTYDLTTEYADLINSYSGDDNWCGPVVGNNIRIVGNRNTKLSFRYTGDNDYIKRDFSPINISGNARIENIMIDVENARYCVHEDLYNMYGANMPVGHLRTEYINCEMRHRGTNGSYNAPFCIGRGDSGNSNFIVDGGFYTAPNSRHITIFCHNGGSVNNPYGNSYMMIKNIMQGDIQDRFRFTAPNQNTVYISICNSLLGDPQIDYGEGAEEKMLVAEWNNTYRTT